MVHTFYISTNPVAFQEIHRYIILLQLDYLAALNSLIVFLIVQHSPKKNLGGQNPK